MTEKQVSSCSCWESHVNLIHKQDIPKKLKTHDGERQYTYERKISRRGRFQSYSRATVTCYLLVRLEEERLLLLLLLPDWASAGLLANASREAGAAVQWGVLPKRP